jgi:hypothetical protein
MKTRIIKSDNGKTWFTPQWSCDGEMWMEFFGFDSDSPYLHVRSFNTLKQATAFLLNPSIVKGEVLDL